LDGAEMLVHPRGEKDLYPPLSSRDNGGSVFKLG